VIKSCTVFATHLAHTLGMFCGILNQTHVANSHSAFGRLFWSSGKCVFDKKMRFVTSKTPLGRVHFLVKWELLFFQNAIQVQLHSGKTPIVSYWKMKLQETCKMTCTSAMSLLQLPCNGSTGQVPLLEHETFSRNTSYMQIFDN